MGLNTWDQIFITVWLIILVFTIAGITNIVVSARKEVELDKNSRQENTDRYRINRMIEEKQT